MASFGTIAYLPPRKVDNAATFSANLRQFKTRHPIVTYSSDPHSRCRIKIPSPEIIGSKKSPWMTSNMVFLQGLRQAHYHHFDYFLYLESDCRMRGNGWDAVIADEILSRFPMDCVMGGSPICWAPSGDGHETLKRIIEFAWHHQNLTGLAMPIYANTQYDQTSLYPNGGGAVFHTRTLLQYVFPRALSNPIEDARIDAWDRMIGRHLWREFGVGLLSKFVSLKSAYSGFGDQVIPLSERKRMLTSGEKVLVHQVKENWLP